MEGTQIVVGLGSVVNLGAALWLIGRFRELRQDLKQDRSDALQLLVARFEIIIKDTVRGANRG